MIAIAYAARRGPRNRRRATLHGMPFWFTETYGLREQDSVSLSDALQPYARHGAPSRRVFHYAVT